MPPQLGDRGLHQLGVDKTSIGEQDDFDTLE